MGKKGSKKGIPAAACRGLGKSAKKALKSGLKNLPKEVREMVSKGGHGAAWCKKLLNPKDASKTDGPKTSRQAPTHQQNLRSLLSKNMQRILVIGDGNFSFANSLVSEIFRGEGSNIAATCYDSEEVLGRKYADAAANVERLRDSGATVLFEVDGTR